MDGGTIGRVRSFNRTVAEGIGALGDRFLGRSRPMTASRLLWEIGPDGLDIRSLRQRLGLDSGFVSRTLRLLERQQLIRVTAHPEDRRVRRATLTKTGLRERAELDRRSDLFASAMIAPLNDAQRATLLEAMSTVERLLQASFVRFAMEDPASAEARWCVEQYFAEIRLRFEGGFNRDIVLPAEPAEMRPPNGAFFVASLHGRPVGCGGVKLHGRAPAELKRMWVSPTARGLGIGRRLLAELEACAQRAGAGVIRLETNRALQEAIRLYRQSGYVEVPPFNDEPHAHYWFEKPIARRGGPRRRRPRRNSP